MWVYPSVIFVQEKVEKAVTLEELVCLTWIYFFFVAFFLFFSSTLFLFYLSPHHLSPRHHNTHKHTHTHTHNTDGTCMTEAACTGVSEAGHCPGSSANLCCIQKECHSNGQTGKCQHQKTCMGTTQSGLCPGPSETSAVWVPFQHRTAPNTPTSSPSTRHLLYAPSPAQNYHLLRSERIDIQYSRLRVRLVLRVTDHEHVYGTSQIAC